MASHVSVKKQKLLRFCLMIAKTSKKIENIVANKAQSNTAKKNAKNAMKERAFLIFSQMSLKKSH